MGRLIYTTYTDAEFRILLSEVLQPIVADQINKTIPTSLLLTTEEAEYLTRKQVCNLLKLSLPTLSRLIKCGSLKPKIVGCSYRFSKKQINTYMNSQNNK